MKTKPFKICTTCSKAWETLEDFLSDPEVSLTGYQVYFEDLGGGLLCFTHLHENCFTMLAIPAKEFTKLSSRPFLASHGKQPACCPGLCMRQGALEPCPVECECLWVREVMQVIRDWDKAAA